MMARHAAPDDEPVVTETPAPVQQPLVHRVFADKFLPHWGMGAVTALYIGFNAVLGVAAVPPTISLAWTATLGTWFGYLIRIKANKE
jgi:hypothetical protein